MNLARFAFKPDATCFFCSANCENGGVIAYDAVRAFAICRTCSIRIAGLVGEWVLDELKSSIERLSHTSESLGDVLKELRSKGGAL